MTLTTTPVPVDVVRHPKVLTRLLSKTITTDNGCWEFTGNTIADGYGGLHVRVEDRDCTLRAHRISYTAFCGPIPEGMDLDHLCSNRLCINPDHLEPVPHRTNVLRGKHGASGESGFIGVRRMRSRWQARLNLDGGETLYLGCFDDPAEAARVFDAAVCAHLGPDADTNESMGLLPPLAATRTEATS